MSMPCQTQQFDHQLTQLSEAIQKHGDRALDGILERLTRLQAQATVQRALVSAAEILCSQPKDNALPNQQATRVKHLLRFVFESSPRNEERSARLRKLECNALKFCGLTYTIRNLLALTESQFDFLLDYVADFVQSRCLVRYLYRSDINKALDIDLDAASENEQLFREFLYGGSYQ